MAGEVPTTKMLGDSFSAHAVVGLVIRLSRGGDRKQSSHGEDGSEASLESKPHGGNRKPNGYAPRRY